MKRNKVFHFPAVLQTMSSGNEVVDEIVSEEEMVEGREQENQGALWVAHMPIACGLPEVPSGRQSCNFK